jgi:ribonuclease III
MLFAKSKKATDVEKTIGYVFKDRALLTTALTHSSARIAAQPRSDYERLEFLGDRVLGLAIAEMISAAFPEASEGDLARKFNRLVRGGTCALVAGRIGLGAQLVLSESEAVHGGRAKETILADAMEAVLGAVFLEAGFDAARLIVRKLWGGLLEGLPDVAVDPKSALQEWAQGKGLPLPHYKEKARKGPDHAPKFISQVTVAGFDPTQGEGPSKRSAEQAAATAFLKSQNVWTGTMND